MKSTDTVESLVSAAYHSEKIKKLAILLTLAGMAMCLSIILLPAGNILFSMVSAARLKGLSLFGFIVLTFVLCCLFAKRLGCFIENAKNEKPIILVCSAITLAALAFIGVFSYKYGWQWLNSDHSSEMALGKLLANENTFVSRNWYYSTEIRLIYQTLFTMPLFKLFGNLNNWALIRSVNIVLNNLVLILSYLFMAKQMKLPAKWIAITSLFLLAPLSSLYWDIVTFGGYYIFIIAQIFFALGLYIGFTNHSGTVKTLIPRLILFSLAAFVLGAQGIRFVLCFHIPLIIACVYTRTQTKQKTAFLVYGICGFFAGGAGYAVNFLLHRRFSFSSHDDVALENLFENFLPKLGQSFASLVEFFGYSGGVSLMSVQGIFGVMAIIAAAVFFITAARFFRKTSFSWTSTAGDNSENDKVFCSRFFTIFFAASVIFNIFVFIVSDTEITPRYFIPFMTLYIPLAAILFDHVEKSSNYIRRAALVFGILLFAGGRGILTVESLADWNSNERRNGYIQYLLDNNLDYGFATFWNANITTELTNGKIEINGQQPDISGGFKENWLQPVQFRSPLYHEGESFLLLTRSEWETARKAGMPFSETRPDYADNEFVIKRFDSARIIHEEVLNEPPL